jgi:hypothetical protein
MSKEKKSEQSQELNAKAIKEMELSKRAPVVDLTEKVEFDYWWALRKDQLNQPAHLKEIVLADMKGRGLSKEESLDSWDKAARIFGLKF